MLPDEIVVVDASDIKTEHRSLQTEFSEPGIVWLDSTPSVCRQRNAGIRKATGEWILLCDDDIELANDYLSTLMAHVQSHPDCGAVAGRLLQREGDQWVDQYPVKDFSELFWRFIFQSTVWGRIDGIRVPALLWPLYQVILRFYRVRGNTISLAGWPLITEWTTPVFQTVIYSMGANLVRRSWLLASPYDETLDPSGIGDNYGVALGFPGHRPIHVLSTTWARHHRAPGNRLSTPLAYYRRILALHYFLLKRRVGTVRTFWLIWSLVGNLVVFLFHGERQMAVATWKAIGRILTSNNPYWSAHLSQKKCIAPHYERP